MYSFDTVIVPAVLLVLSFLAAAGPSTVSKMTLRDGRTFFLREPPRLAGSRIVFTTIDGKVYSMAESEVVSITVVPPPTPAPRAWNPQDSRALGAIARVERGRRGIRTDLAPVSPRRSDVTRKHAARGAARSPSATPVPRTNS